MLAWLSVWSEVQTICIWSSQWHCNPIISCFIKIQIGCLTFLVPVYPGFPGKKVVKRLCALQSVLRRCAVETDCTFKRATVVYAHSNCSLITVPLSLQNIHWKHKDKLKTFYTLIAPSQLEHICIRLHSRIKTRQKNKRAWITRDAYTTSQKCAS